MNSTCKFYAQQTTIASGGDFIANSGSISFSLGQTVYLTNHSTKGTEVQGVQQPFEIYLLNSIENTPLGGFNACLYPNPTNNLIQLSLESINPIDFRFLILDSKGIILKSQKLTSTQTSIDFNLFPSATYFIKIIGNKTFKAFKIIKN